MKGINPKHTAILSLAIHKTTGITVNESFAHALGLLGGLASAYGEAPTLDQALDAWVENQAAGAETRRLAVEYADSNVVPNKADIASTADAVCKVIGIPSDPLSVN